MYSGKKYVGDCQWIWSSKTPDEKNQYIYFKKEIEVNDIPESAEMFISADSDYALYINGVFVNCGQYLSYPHIKFYDTLDIKAYIKEGNNTFRILVFYSGADTSSYVAGMPGLYAETVIDGKQYFTDNSWEYTYDTGYENGDMYIITNQIGYGFKFDAGKEKSSKEWKQALVCEESKTLPYEIFERPVKKLMFKKPRTKAVNKTGRHFLIDLEKEYSGYFTLSLNAEADVKIKINYEEYADTEKGIIPEDPDNRNFCFYYTTGGGEEEFTHFLRKIGCRYLQIDAEKEIFLQLVGIIPVEYPVKELEKPKMPEIHSRIYDMCVYTLKNCMHEKYEDTPWREQALYGQDARNQALYGYSVFDNKEFPLACMKLLKESLDEDGFVQLTAPSEGNRCIPYFTYMWLAMVTEYYKYGGDEEQARLLFPYVQKVFDKHIDKYTEEGLVSVPCKEGIWSFYEWADGLDGAYYDENNNWRIIGYDKERKDAIYNLFFLVVLKEFVVFCDKLGVCSEKYSKHCDMLSDSINKNFYNDEKELYCSYVVKGEKQHYCELTQSLAVLSGVCDDNVKSSLIQTLAGENNLVKVTLSCMLFKFEAILSGGKEKESFVLNEIERIFTPMLSKNGSGCCWETEKGKADFRGCGSMCHGWSAFPVHFYRKIFK